MQHTRTHVWGTAGSVLDVQMSEGVRHPHEALGGSQAHVQALGAPARRGRPCAKERT